MKNSYIASAQAAELIDMRIEVFKEPTYRVLRQCEEDNLRRKKMGMGIAYAVFLSVIIFFMGVVFVKYLSLYYEINTSVDNITAYEEELRTLTLTNDDEEKKLQSSVNIDEVKRIAINELGMTYPDESQVITYERESDDYVNQVGYLH